MAKAPKLKVFTAPIGFHDVYVAAPSRAAALRAWGSDHDLFARGVASEVTDTDLTKEPLAKPGEVIRRLRGTEAEQFAALPKDERPATKKARTHNEAPKKPVRTSRPHPRPSRKALDAAEAALKVAQTRHREKDDAAREKVEEAQRERRELQQSAAAEARLLSVARDDARDRYEHELDQWREGQ